MTEMKKDVAKRVKVQPVFEGTILSKARKIIDRRGVLPLYKGKPVIAIDADGEEYNFQSCAEVERTTLISAGRIQSASVDKALPKEGEVVYIAFRDKTGFGVNVATFENGVFNSYSTNKPDYWMHVPVLPKVEDEV